MQAVWCCALGTVHEESPRHNAPAAIEPPLDAPAQDFADALQRILADTAAANDRAQVAEREMEPLRRGAAARRAREPCAIS
jgi:hypothetical protein